MILPSVLSVSKSNTYRAWTLRIRMIEPINIETLFRELGASGSPVAQHLPERLGRRCITGKLESKPNDGEGSHIMIHVCGIAGQLCQKCNRPSREVFPNVDLRVWPRRHFSCVREKGPSSDRELSAHRLDQDTSQAYRKCFLISQLGENEEYRSGKWKPWSNMNTMGLPKWRWNLLVRA